MGRTFDKIIGYTAAGLLIAAVAGYYYVVYGPDISKTLDNLQKGKLRGSLSDSPLGSNNPFDRALQDKPKRSNVSYADNSNSSYLNIEEEEKDEQNLSSNLSHR
jgi:hypothetical protein